MPATTNIIRTERINMVYNGHADGMALQQEVAAWCRQSLNPAIDDLLAGFAQTGEVIIVPSINVDIAVNAGQDWKEGLIEKILHQVTSEIEACSYPGSVHVTTTGDRFAETLAFFVEHGILPWHSTIASREVFLSEMRRWLPVATDAQLWVLLPALQQVQGLRRFLHLFDDSVFYTVIARLAGLPVAGVQVAVEDMQKIIRNDHMSPAAQQDYLRHFITRLLALISRERAVPLFATAFAQWINDAGDTLQQYLQAFDASVLSHDEVIIAVRHFQQQHTVTSTNIADTLTPATRIKKGEMQQRTESDNNSNSNSNNAALSAALNEGVFISNAGLVIIAPFLPALFRHTGLLQDDKLQYPGTALSLLYYCIYGVSDPAEFSLLLPKLLCGLDPDAVAEVAQVTDRHLLSEADQMLTSLIEHWQVLKNTSTDGLREAFLQRNGRLRFANNRWLLQVEQQSYDMLLQQLPWSIQMIQFQWMPYMLHTEWI